MDINLAFRPLGATHAGKEESHGSWYKKNEAGQWMFIDMGEDGLPERQWSVVIDDEPGYELFELPREHPVEAPATKPRADGNAAFPTPASENNREWYGMSLRDYFAAKAMGGIVANIVKGHVSYGNTQDMAARCYEIADEMLAARSA